MRTHLLLWLWVCQQNTVLQYCYYLAPVSLPLASLPSSWACLCSLSPHNIYKHLQFPKHVTRSLVSGSVCVLFPLFSPNSSSSVGFLCILSSQLRYHYLLKVLYSHPCPRAVKLPFLSVSRHGGLPKHNTESLSYSCLLYSSLFLLVFISSPVYLPHLYCYPVLPRDFFGDDSDFNDSTKSSPPPILPTHGSLYHFFMAPTTVWGCFHAGLLLPFAHPFSISTLLVTGPWTCSVTSWPIEWSNL